MLCRTIFSLLALVTVSAGMIVLSCPSALSSSLIEIFISPQPVFVEEDTSFSIWINIGNVESPGVYGYLLALYYDTGRLDATNASIPEDHFLTPSSPMNVFIIDGGTIDKELGRVSFGVSLLGTEGGKTGSGVLACIEFTAVSQGNCSLTFGDIILADHEGNEIPSSQIVLENGSVSVGAGTPAPALSPFKVFVGSQSSFVNVGQKLSIGIYIVKAPLPGIFVYRLSLGYNCTMLEAVAAGIPEGSFLDTSSPETFSIVDNGTIDSVLGRVSFEAARLAPEEGRTGKGVLGRVEFVALASGNCSLAVVDIALMDQDGNLFPSSQYERVSACVVIPSSLPPPPQHAMEVYEGSLNVSVTANDILEIDVFITNVTSPGLFAYQFTLHYDCALVQAVAAEIPEGHFLTPSSPGRAFIVDPGTINNEFGQVCFAVALLEPEEGKTGDGLLASAQFKAVAAGNVTFRLEDIVLVRPDGSVWDYKTRDDTVSVTPEFQSVTMAQILILLASLVIVITRRVKPHRFL